MIIQHNIMAINSHRQLGVNNTNLGKNLEKLSSGYRINKAADDAAGLAISEKMRAQITGLDRAILNAQDASSLIQTAEGALTEVHDMLNRMVELATQSANGTMDTSAYANDRQKIEDELDSLKAEIDRISQATNFNGLTLLDGSLGMGTSALGTGNTIFQLGAELDTDLVITGITGISGPANATFTLSVATVGEQGKVDGIPSSVADADVGQYIKLTMETEDGGTTVKAMKIEDLISVKKADGTAYIFGGDENGDFNDLASGDLININLTGFGLGNVSLVATNDITGTDNDGHGDWGDVLAKIIDQKLEPGTSAGGGLTMQVGDTAQAFNKITVSVDDMGTAGLGIDTITMLTQDEASDSLDKIKAAIEKVSTNRSALGAMQNRLEHTIANLGVTSENMTAAESRIRDVDMAKEMMQFTKNNVLGQAAQAMLAQANQQPQQVLQLLR